ncbi:MAG: hypothetical protein JO195_02085 [Candidatus Eremiobacteraeota bacterium]|nr:hypothetical protein [Candidatus Eremiobacteraeota bacterium]MBV8667593.1 hypothetical protein [Candidatus Eremiobacteraeota bacterium]
MQTNAIVSFSSLAGMAVARAMTYRTIVRVGILAALLVMALIITTQATVLADKGASAKPKARATPSTTTAQAPTNSVDQGAGERAEPEHAPTRAEEEAFIKESQNPIGNVAILPFQNNWNYAAGPSKTTVWNMNIQPVVPFMLSPKANLIERVITPVVNLTPLLQSQDCFALGITVSSPPCGAELGIGNIQLQTFYAPKTNPNGFIWGVGPMFSFPTVSKHLGTQQFGGGIDAVGLVMPGHWVTGMLVTQRWYIAGPSSAAENTLNQLQAQPFINFNFGKGWALSEAPLITANWNEPGNQKWTVPIGLQVGNTNTWLKLPMAYQLAYYGNIVRPQFAPYGLIRFNWAILWPVKRGY